eukprot:11763724-Alexandrium_andersonii.AAC.1
MCRCGRGSVGVFVAGCGGSHDARALQRAFYTPGAAPKECVEPQSAILPELNCPTKWQAVHTEAREH